MERPPVRRRSQLSAQCAEAPLRRQAARWPVVDVAGSSVRCRARVTSGGASIPPCAALADGCRGFRARFSMPSGQLALYAMVTRPSGSASHRSAVPCAVSECSVEWRLRRALTSGHSTDAHDRKSQSRPKIIGSGKEVVWVAFPRDFSAARTLPLCPDGCIYSVVEISAARSPVARSLRNAYLAVLQPVAVPAHDLQSLSFADL